MRHDPGFPVELDEYRQVTHVSRRGGHVLRNLTLKHYHHRHGGMLQLQKPPHNRRTGVIGEVCDQLIRGILIDQCAHIDLAHVGIDNFNLRLIAEFMRKIAGKGVVDFDG